MIRNKQLEEYIRLYESRQNLEHMFQAYQTFKFVIRVGTEGCLGKVYRSAYDMRSERMFKVHISSDARLKLFAQGGACV